MPLLTITLTAGRNAAEKRQILDLTHAALTEAGFPAADRFQRLIELDASAFLFDARYPNLEKDRSTRFMIIEVLLSQGRSRAIKDRFELLVRRHLAAGIGLEPHDVFVVFIESDRPGLPLDGESA